MTIKRIYIPAKFIPGDRRQKTFVTNGKCKREIKVTSYKDNYFLYLFKKNVAVYDVLVLLILLFSSRRWKRFEIIICFASSSTRVTKHTERSRMLQQAVFSHRSHRGWDGVTPIRARVTDVISFATNDHNSWKQVQRITIIAILSISIVHIPVYSRCSAKCTTREKENVFLHLLYEANKHKFTLMHYSILFRVTT